MGSGPNTAQFTQLSSKVETLIRTYLQVNVFPDISKRVSIMLQSHARSLWPPDFKSILPLDAQEIFAGSCMHARPCSPCTAKRDACVMLNGIVLHASMAFQVELMLLLACRWRGYTLGGRQGLSCCCRRDGG